MIIRLIQQSWLSLASLASIGLMLISSSLPILAAPTQPQSIEETFDMFDKGVVSDPETIKMMLGYLQDNITIQDSKHYLKLQPLLCWNNFDINDNEQITAAIEFANLKLASQEIAQSGETATDLKLCRAYMYQLSGEVDAALNEYNKIVDQAYRIESPKLIADARSLRGAMHSFQGDFAQALEDLITAQHLYESLNLEHWALYNLTELATSYRRFGDPQAALRYYQKLTAEFTKRGDDDSANFMKAEMAYALEELGEHEAALEKHIQSYQYWKNKSGLELSAHRAVNVAGVLIQLNRVKEAETYLAEAEEFITPSKGASYSFMRLYQAQIALYNENMDQALSYIEEAKNSFLNIKNTRGLEQLYRLEGQVHSTKQDWEKATIALQDYIATHALLDATQQTNRTTEMRTRFNTEQIERENKQLLELQKVKENELIILNHNKYLQLAVILLGCIIMVILAIIAHKQSKKSKLLSILALTDHLTQLPNRRSTYTKAEGYFKSKRLNDHPLSLILFDADHFKKVNDQFGHDKGDKVLISLANISSNLMRKQDLVGRVGGEEFLVILPGTTAEQALNIAQRLVTTVESSNFDDISPNFKLTISAGIATQIDDVEFDALLKRADKALYSAKYSGRNCAVLSNENSL